MCLSLEKDWIFSELKHYKIGLLWSLKCYIILTFIYIILTFLACEYFHSASYTELHKKNRHALTHDGVYKIKKSTT